MSVWDGRRDVTCRVGRLRASRVAGAGGCRVGTRWVAGEGSRDVNVQVAD